MTAQSIFARPPLLLAEMIFLWPMFFAFAALLLFLPPRHAFPTFALNAAWPTSTHPLCVGEFPLRLCLPACTPTHATLHAIFTHPRIYFIVMMLGLVESIFCLPQTAVRALPGRSGPLVLLHTFSAVGLLVFLEPLLWQKLLFVLHEVATVITIMIIIIMIMNISIIIMIIIIISSDTPGVGGSGVST